MDEGRAGPDTDGRPGAEQDGRPGAEQDGRPGAEQDGGLRLGGRVEQVPGHRTCVRLAAGDTVTQCQHIPPVNPWRQEVKP